MKDAPFDGTREEALELIVLVALSNFRRYKKFTDEFRLMTQLEGSYNEIRAQFDGKKNPIDFEESSESEACGEVHSVSPGEAGAVDEVSSPMLPSSVIRHDELGSESCYGSREVLRICGQAEPALQSRQPLHEPILAPINGDGSELRRILPDETPIRALSFDQILRRHYPNGTRGVSESTMKILRDFYQRGTDGA